MPFRILALLTLFTLPIAAQQEPSLTPPAQSVVQVLAHSNCSTNFQGSGVVVGRGIVLTSAHVVQGTEETKVILNGTTYFASAHILAPELDLCLLRVPALLAPPVTLAAEGAIKVGEKVQAIGFPGGLGLTTTSGILTEQWQFRGSQLIQSNAIVRHGNSGGGLFTEDGRLVGITTFLILTYEGLGFCVPASWIPKLLQRPWQQGTRIALCRSKDLVLQDFLEGMVEDPSNRQAWEAYSRAWVASRPKDPDAWYSLGYTLSLRTSEDAMTPDAATSIRQAARQAYARALELNPTLTRAWNNQGVILDELGESEAAAVSFRMAVALKKDYGLAWINLGTAYMNTHEYENAAKAFKRGLELIPDESPAWSRLSSCEAMLGHLDDSIRYLRIALRLSPMRMEWWLDLAQTCRRAKRPGEFEGTLSFLRERLPSYAKEISIHLKASAL